MPEELLELANIKSDRKALPPSLQELDFLHADQFRPPSESLRGERSAIAAPTGEGRSGGKPRRPICTTPFHPISEPFNGDLKRLTQKANS